VPLNCEISDVAPFCRQVKGFGPFSSGRPAMQALNPRIERSGWPTSEGQRAAGCSRFYLLDIRNGSQAFAAAPMNLMQRVIRSCRSI
jgi:hypothetical protein